MILFITVLVLHFVNNAGFEAVQLPALCFALLRQRSLEHQRQDIDWFTETEFVPAPRLSRWNVVQWSLYSLSQSLLSLPVAARLTPISCVDCVAAPHGVHDRLPQLLATAADHWRSKRQQRCTPVLTPAPDVEAADPIFRVVRRRVVGVWFRRVRAAQRSAVTQ